MNNEMTMTYEFITPERAETLLESNDSNRKLSKGTAQSYANDILSGNWDEHVGVAISLDADGRLRDGQHRCMAIVIAGQGIWSWVCRNVSPDGIYDNNRKRSNSDQISIMKSDYENVYKSTRYISVARALITMNDHENRRKVSPKEIIEFTDKHKAELDGFFLNISQTTVPKISLAVVHLALYLAYVNGINMEDIDDFYEILCSGMCKCPEEHPIIAYRNYLKDNSNVTTTMQEIGRCQYALKKYLTNSCTQRNISPKELIWNNPYKED